ncbi:MAG: phosphoribosylglycinamide formyltransferase [Thioalkalivibrio sp.]
MSQAKPMPLVVLISGAGTNLQALIDAIAAGEIHGHITAVISNRPGARGLERAARAGIPTHVLDHTAYLDRAAFDQAMTALIDGHTPGLVVLAGFMRILTPDFVEHYTNRLINIHPSLLPDFRGLKTHERALRAGVKEHGASVHFVNNELDGGPVIMQARVEIRPDDTPEILAARVLQREHRLYPRAVGLLAAGRLTLRDGQVWLDHKPLDAPLDMDTDGQRMQEN